MCSNVSSFWKFVNTKRTRHEIPGKVHLGSTSAPTQATAANLFAEFFGSVYSPQVGVAPALSSGSSSYDAVNMHSISISIGQIYSKLNSLDTSKGPGYDGIPPLFLKECCFILARPLWHIFNSSLDKGIFPEAWKTTLVTPVFKAGDRSDVRNYRPICKLSVMPKVFEELITEQLTPCLTKVICDEQHGFVPGRSTTTNLAVYHCFVSDALEAGRQVDTVYTDFRKAFDSVDHYILHRKLATIGICGSLLAWIISYLEGRVQVIRVWDRLSDPVNATSGVPQGSHLGPLLFLLFINDLNEVFMHSRFLMYADDLKIFRTISGSLDINLLQADLTRFEQWCTVNRMRLNTVKCVLLRSHRSVSGIPSMYMLCDTTLSEVAEVQDLGVLFTTGLDFRNHYRNITCKAMKTLGFIARFGKHFKHIRTLKLLFVALVRPQIEYASVIWSPRHKQYTNLIERIQHKFLRLAMRTSGRPMLFSDHNYGPALLKTRLHTLSDRRVCSDLLFIYKVFHGQINCQELVERICFHAPQRSLRPRPLFVSRVPTYHYYSADPINRAADELNQCPVEIDLFLTSFASFRTLILKSLPPP